MNRFEILNKNPIELQKLFTTDYWVSAGNIATPPVHSYSYHFWGYIALIVLLLLVAFAFRIYKGIYLDNKTIDNIIKDNDPKNPIYSRYSFFEGYYMVAAYMTAFFFLCRQAEIAILGNKLFMLLVIIYILVGLYMFVRYLMTDKQIEEQFFMTRKTI
jgi:uncharacterized protein YneF (UPF0154 family)